MKIPIFKWIIELKLKDKTAEERVLYLANRLTDEVEKADETRLILIWNHGEGEITVEGNVETKYSVKGERK